LRHYQWAVGSPIDLPNQAEFNHKHNPVSRISGREVASSVLRLEAAHFEQDARGLAACIGSKSNITSSDGSYQEINWRNQRGGEIVPDTNLSRRAGFFPSLGLIAVPAIVIARSTVVVTVSAIVITGAAIINLSRIVTTHSRFEVPDALAKPLGDLRYATRTEQDDYYHRYHQQLGHSKWTHVETP
jgi:hypothetical protein